MAERSDHSTGDPRAASAVEVHHQATLVHGRYLLREGRHGEAPPLLVGFHGFGEKSEQHMEKLQGIPGSEHWLLVAVEALHPFYTRKGKIVASWMTGQDRELAIDDNIRYVASVVAALKRRYPKHGPLVFCGFSQGVAMAYRAAARSGHPCHGLIALAGDVPPAIGAGELPGFPPILLGRGTEDAWYDVDKMSQDLEVLARHGIDVETCVFEGGHDWEAPFYAAAGRFLDTIRAAGS